MTREQAKELLPIIQAWAEGKNVQFLSDGEWHDINQADFTCYPDKYRIKPEPKYRPFKGMEERWNEMQNHHPFGWIKRNGKYVNITLVSGECSYDDSFKSFTFADGEPFGIKEE